MDIQKDIRLAVLIDADNVPYSNVKGLIIGYTWYEACANFGQVRFCHNHLYKECSCNYRNKGYNESFHFAYA